MPRRVVIGIVTSDRAAKTRRVEMARLVKHPVYGKYIRRRTVFHVHDENEEAQLGDRVEIVESRPHSKLKRWELVRVVEKSKEVDLASLKASHRRRKDQLEAAEETSEQGGQQGPTS